MKLTLPRINEMWNYGGMSGKIHSIDDYILAVGNGSAYCICIWDFLSLAKRGMLKNETYSSSK